MIVCGLAVFFTFLLAPPARAGHADQRYHAILIDHDNASLVQGPGGVQSFVWPQASALKGFDLVFEAGSSPVADPGVPGAASGGSPLVYTGRDSARFEQFLLRYTHSGLIERVSHQHDGPPLPANDLRGGLRANNLSDVGQAFQATACRLADLDPKRRTVDPAYDCTGIDAPAEVRAEGAGKVEDVVFVTFSGHGLPGGLVLPNGLLDAEALELLVGSLPADLVVVIIDACFGGAYSGDGSARHQPIRSLRAGVLGGPRRIAVFNSASVVPEDDPLRSGFLTHIMLSGLQGAADDDRDGRVRYEELAGFFELNSSISGDMAGRTAAPRGNRRRVLFDHHMALGGSQVLTVDRNLGGRFLVAEDEGALAEVNVTNLIWGKSSRVDLHLPVEDGLPEVDLYYLPIRDLPRSDRLTLWEDDYHLLRKPTWIREFNGLTAGDDIPLARYLEDSQKERRGFSHQAERIGLMGLGNRASLTLTSGYVRTEAYGRMLDRLDDPDIPLSHEQLMEDLADAEASSWNLAQVGLTGRVHFLGCLLAEGRGEVWGSPQAKVMGSQSSLFMSRLAGGAGVAGYLGTRALAGSASGGGGLMNVWAKGLGDDGPLLADGTEALPVFDSFHPGWYVAAGAKLALPRVPALDLEVAWLDDRVGYRRTSVGPDELGLNGVVGSESRTDRYSGLRVTLGMTLGVLPR